MSRANLCVDSFAHVLQNGVWSSPWEMVVLSIGRIALGCGLWEMVILCQGMIFPKGKCVAQELLGKWLCYQQTSRNGRCYQRNCNALSNTTILWLHNTLIICWSLPLRSWISLLSSQFSPTIKLCEMFNFSGKFAQ